MRVVIIGKGLMLSNLILGAYDAGAKIVGVLRYEKTCENPLKLFFKDTFNPEYDYTLIKELGLKQLNFKSVNSESFRNFLIKENIDMLIVGTWRQKIKKETFNIPKIGTINVHPSLLPKYRGPNPYLQTILNGEEYSGVTLHLVDENYDTGAVLAQKRIKIDDRDTSKELREKTVIEARNLIYDFITSLNTSIVTPIAQSQKNSSYYPNISGEEKMLDFENMTSVEIYRTIRALHPFLPTYITVGKRFLKVNPYKFSVLDEVYEDYCAGDIIEKDVKSKGLTILCKDKKAIKFTDLKLYRAKIFTSLFLRNCPAVKHNH